MHSEGSSQGPFPHNPGHYYIARLISLELFLLSWGTPFGSSLLPIAFARLRDPYPLHDHHALFEVLFPLLISRKPGVILRPTANSVWEKDLIKPDHPPVGGRGRPVVLPGIGALYKQLGEKKWSWGT